MFAALLLTRASIFALKLAPLPKRVLSRTMVNGDIDPPSGGGKSAVKPGAALEKSTPNSSSLSEFISNTKASIAI